MKFAHVSRALLPGAAISLGDRARAFAQASAKKADIVVTGIALASWLRAAN